MSICVCAHTHVLCTLYSMQQRHVGSPLGPQTRDQLDGNILHMGCALLSVWHVLFLSTETLPPVGSSLDGADTTVVPPARQAFGTPDMMDAFSDL